MRVIKPSKTTRKLVSMEIDPKVLDAATAAAKKAGLSRQKLIEGILRQVLSDPKFVLKLEE